MPVPNTSRRSITDERYSEITGSTASDNIIADNIIGSSQKSNYSTTQSASLSTENGESLASIEDEDKIKELLSTFQEPERSAVRELPASSNSEDLALMVKLYQAGKLFYFNKFLSEYLKLIDGFVLFLGYFKGEHHLEEIMYFENLRRSQLLQLLDKFRDVLIIYETEDPAIATLYTQA